MDINYLPVSVLLLVKARSNSVLFYHLNLTFSHIRCVFSNSWVNAWLSKIYTLADSICEDINNKQILNIGPVTLDRGYNQPTCREASQNQNYSIWKKYFHMSLMRGFWFTIKTLTSVWACPALFFTRHLFASFTSTSVFSGTQVLF